MILLILTLDSSDLANQLISLYGTVSQMHSCYVLEKANIFVVFISSKEFMLLLQREISVHFIRMESLVESIL